jgi:hypothetical protein
MTESSAFRAPILGELAAMMMLTGKNLPGAIPLPCRAARPPLAPRAVRTSFAFLRQHIRPDVGAADATAQGCVKCI